MTRSQRRILFDTGALGVALTLLAVVLDQGGWLRPLEQFSYDLRARRCQIYAHPPTTQLVHLDIDDASLEEVGRWPWPRDRQAELLEELRRAGPKVIAMDVFYSEPDVQEVMRPDGTKTTVDRDPALAAAVKDCGNVMLAVHVLTGSRPPADPARRGLADLLALDLEQDDAHLAEGLRQWGLNGPGVPGRIEREAPFALKEAMYRRIDQALGMHAADADAEALRRKLLPASVATGVRSSADEVLYKTLPKVLAERELVRFSLPVDSALPPMVTSDLEEPPVAALSRAAAACGHAEYPGVVGDGIVRSVPLFIRYRDRLVPQFGLVLACSYLGVDIHDLQITPDHVTLPRPGGADVVIPVHDVRTSSGDCGLFMDIPWVGGRAWEAMYDFPNHRAEKQHVPFTRLWDIRELGRRIEENNRLALYDVLTVLHKSDDEDRARALQIAPPPPGDVAAWNAAIAGAEQALRDDPTKAAFLCYLNQGAACDLSAVPEADREYATAIRNLPVRSRLNDTLAAGRQKLRDALRDEVQGKAVIVGFMAAGGLDEYATPLHTKCPGAVAHGAIFSGILTGELWRTQSPWVTAAATMALGLVATAAATALTPGKSFATAAVLLVGYLLFNGVYLFDKHDTIVGVAGPVFAVAGVWSACTLTRFLRVSAEKAFITRQFSSYVDPALVKCLMEHPERASFKGEEHELSVVFTDLAGFTSISEKLKKETVPLLNEYLGLMEPLVRENCGLVNKFLGDGIMFFFGAPEPHPDGPNAHAEAAVKTVLAMQAAMGPFNEGLAKRNLPALKVRAGVSTGEMVVGNAGTATRSDYTVLGDRVNFASRLESANKATGTLTLISERTAELLDGKYLLRPVGRLQVVGKKEWVMTYEPLGQLSQATDRQKRLAELCETVTARFADADFKGCMEAVAGVASEFNDGSQQTWCELYRRLCEEYIVTPPKVFAGQIRLEQK